MNRAVISSMLAPSRLTAKKNNNSGLITRFPFLFTFFPLVSHTVARVWLMNKEFKGHVTACQNPLSKKQAVVVG